MNNVYLCGAMSCYLGTSDYEDKAIKWRETAEIEFLNTGVKVFNPTKVDYDTLDWNDQAFVELNLRKLKNSLCLIVNAENIEKSPGSIVEITLAYGLRIPIFWFGELTTPSPHVRRMLGINKYTNLQDAIRAVRVTYELDDIEKYKSECITTLYNLKH